MVVRAAFPEWDHEQPQVPCSMLMFAHAQVAVHTFQKKVIEVNAPHVMKVYSFSDGAAG